MGKNKIKIPKAKKTNAELIQINSMRAHYPEFKHHRNKDGNIVFVGHLQPKPEMPVYSVSIEFGGENMPKVFVLEPEIRRDAPHTYPGSGGCLCLYKSSNFKWTAHRPISNYIVGWTASWLYFYEVWKDRGIWYGQEADH